METTFYLKYRPQTFSDLDSTLAREELIKIFSSQNIPHAFLLTGTKGIGKTSAARIIAKAVNCEDRVEELKSRRAGERERIQQSRRVEEQEGRRAGEKFDPCNECDTCVSITNGSNVDVFEIDAASFTSVDDIRDLREKIRLSPTSAKYKVYIIDEVHRLSGNAFDALLKTLEEPPKHAIFVLCTTELEKVPKTIASRCQKIAFKKATNKEVTEKLKKICESEKLDFEEQALLEIAKISEGSFRDATKILEQVSFSGKISEEEVRKTVGIVGGEQIDEFLQILKLRKTKEGLLFINKAVDNSANLKVFTENLLDKFREMLLSGFGIGEEDTNDFSVEETRRLIKIFSEAYGELKYAVISQLPLEMAVIEWCINQDQKSIRQLADKNQKEETNNEEEKNNEENVILRGLPPKDPDEKNKTRRDSSPSVQNDSGSNVIQIPMSHRGKDPDEKNVLENDIKNIKSANFTLEKVVEKWPMILETVKPMNHSVLAFLKACRPLSCEGGSLTLEVFYKFHKDQLESEKCRRIFEKAAGEVLESEVKLYCSLSQNKPQKLEPTPLPPIETKQVSKINTKKPEELDIMKVAEEIFNN